MRKLAALSSQADQAQQAANTRSPFHGRQLAQAEGNIVFNRQMRKQGIILEYHADITDFRRRGKTRRTQYISSKRDMAAA